MHIKQIFSIFFGIRKNVVLKITQVTLVLISQRCLQYATRIKLGIDRNFPAFQLNNYFQKEYN